MSYCWKQNPQMKDDPSIHGWLSFPHIQLLSQVELVVKNPPTHAGNLRDVGSIPGLGRSPGEENGYPLQYSCLENPMEEEPGGLQSTGSQRVGHDWATNTSTLRLSQGLLGIIMDQVLTSVKGQVQPGCLEEGKRMPRTGSLRPLAPSAPSHSAISFSSYLPDPPPPTFSHPPATAALASVLPGIRKASSAKSRARL